MLISYIIIAFISFLLSVVILLIFLKKKSREHDSVVRNFEQKIEILVDEQQTLSQQNVALQEERKRLRTTVQALSRYKGIVKIDEVIAQKKRHFLEERNKALEKLNQQIRETKKKIKTATQESLRREGIVNRSIEAKEKKVKSTIQQAEEQILQQKNDTKQTIKEMYKEAKKKHEEIFMSSSADASEIIARAEQQAKEIAGDALKAVAHEKELEKAIKAMRNTIKGYGEEYLISSDNFLDELADEYNFKKAGQELKKVRESIRLMIKNETAADCDYVEVNRRNYAIHFVLDAFNGKVDSILSKVRHDNYGKLQQQILDAFNLVNHNGSAFRSARINQPYLDLRMEELKWAVAVHELKVQDREEQKRIKQEMREEVKAKKEYEKAIKEAEKEEKILQKAMEQARKELLSATDAQREEYEARLKDLEEKIHEAEEKNQRAISMAQQTKRGHVYVISNIGSFGDNVLKIGLTRRLEPMDRVKELGDASVPFPFDVHAMMFSEDAPALEKELHQTFNNYQVNKVNQRKEFFQIKVADVKEAAAGLGIETHWTMKAEAREYRESIILAQSEKNRSAVPV
ncbi:MAG: DUF4041 domain-containing protein [Candidatus Electrothrix sp. YB6]